ncbi:LolA family protein [Roseicyclus mahoneyensis]|jgi:outer membrane lipoprotein-sorting protein|uniref:Outer membrane lipoprotein-sorting protein n=1 Tax=Roseicyclus mahoneyensis TaxID=164332 RepID=A0A316GIL0_9RHOB|nr:outer membrane lipoprotein carrier protein LolA [Roseicyclus mahoneyensis]PWK60033.1 outer membrane lipoprotein-sorting protein [Roseicyclus mahoneyensis]
MKQLVLALAVSLATAAPALADLVPLSALSRYLNDMDTAQGSFTQINADGSISTGTIYMHRPGRVRFEYPGDDLLVIAGGQQVAIFDGRSNTRPETYPLSETPLNLILARNVDLARSGMVIGHRYDGTATRVLAQDPDRPEIGTIELVFTGDPVELRQWVITDNGGGETTVVLGGLTEGGRLSARLFNITQEIQSRER